MIDTLVVIAGAAALIGFLALLLAKWLHRIERDYPVPPRDDSRG